MWELKCGCNPINEPFEFKICDASYVNPSRIELPYGNDSDLCALRNKILSDYCDILNKLECGIQLDLEFILEKISIMDINNNCSFNSLKQIYQSDDNQQGCLGDEYIIELIDKSHNELSKILKNKIGYVYKDVDNKRYLGFSDVNAYNLYESTNNDNYILATWDINNSGIGYVTYNEEQNEYIAFIDVDKYNEYLKTNNEELIIARWPGNKDKIGYVAYSYKVEDDKYKHYLRFYQSQNHYETDPNNPLYEIEIPIANVQDSIDSINEQISAINNSIGNDDINGTITENIHNINEQISTINDFIGNLVQISNYTVPAGQVMKEKYKEITIRKNINSNESDRFVIKTWEPENSPKFTVEFYDDDGLVESKEYYKGEFVTWPEYTPKNRFRLNGWKTEDNTQYKLTQLYQVNNNTIFRADLEKIIFIVTLHNDSDIREEEVNKGQSITLDNNLSKQNYSFKGWYESEDFVGNPLNTTYTPNDDIDLYAKWIRTYTVTFDTRGGNNIDNIRGVEEGSQINLDDYIPERAGYIFDGWYIDDNRYSGNYTVTSDVTFYAKWNEETNYQYALYNGDPSEFNGNLTKLTEEQIQAMNSNRLTLENLSGFGQWIQTDNPHLIIPKNNDDISRCIEIKDSAGLGTSLIGEDLFEYEIKNNYFILTWNGMGDADPSAKIKFLL